MRVDPNYISGLAASLNSSTLAEQNLTTELSSGLAVSSLSDNPVAAGQASLLNSAISQDDTFVQTASSTESLMQVTDSALGSVVTQLTTALSLAVEGNGGTESAADLASLSQQLSGIRDQVVSLANTNYQGTYIFAGSYGNVQPFTTDTSTTPATTTYHGDPNVNHVNTITTVNGQQIQTGLAGSAVFTAPGANVMTALNNLVADFASGTLSATASTDIGVLQKALSNVSQQRLSLDSSLNRIQTASTYAQTDATNRTAEASSLVAANPATIATQLSAAETQNQALMSVIATVGKQSLFDMIQ
jgi:flagellar hook-associated protein 3 FlgL